MSGLIDIDGPSPWRMPLSMLSTDERSMLYGTREQVKRSTKMRERSDFKGMGYWELLLSVKGSVLEFTFSWAVFSGLWAGLIILWHEYQKPMEMSSWPVKTHELGAVFISFVLVLFSVQAFARYDTGRSSLATLEAALEDMSVSLCAYSSHGQADEEESIRILPSLLASIRHSVCCKDIAENGDLAAIEPFLIDEVAKHLYAEEVLWVTGATDTIPPPRFVIKTPFNAHEWDDPCLQQESESSSTASWLDDPESDARQIYLSGGAVMELIEHKGNLHRRKGQDTLSLGYVRGFPNTLYVQDQSGERLRLRNAEQILALSVILAEHHVPHTLPLPESSWPLPASGDHVVLKDLIDKPSYNNKRAIVTRLDSHITGYCFIVLHESKTNCQIRVHARSLWWPERQAPCMFCMLTIAAGVMCSVSASSEADCSPEGSYYSYSDISPKHNDAPWESVSAIERSLYYMSCERMPMPLLVSTKTKREVPKEITLELNKVPFRLAFLLQRELVDATGGESCKGIDKAIKAWQQMQTIVDQKFPLPLYHIAAFMCFVWIVTVPLYLLRAFSGKQVWLIPLSTMFFAVLFFGLFTLAAELTNPFGFDPNDLDLSANEHRILESMAGLFPNRSFTRQEERKLQTQRRVLDNVEPNVPF